MAVSRREFLLRAFGTFGAAALSFERFGLLAALAQANDYKALVCIFLAGGNDADNTVIPYDNYAEYAAVRQDASTLRIPQSSLLVINPLHAASRFGLHPSLTGLHELWGVGKVAVVCNVGPLVEPTTRDTFLNGSARRPRNLFSHSDQQAQWQTSISDAASPTGWGGRMADKTAQLNPLPGTFPLEVTLAGNTIFLAGSDQRPLAIAPAPTRIDSALRFDGFPDPPDQAPRYRAMRDLLAVDNHLTLVRSASATINKTMEIEATLRLAGDPVAPFPLNPRTTLGNQLEQVAKLISLRDFLGMRRQIFFCSLGGFDTHNSQVAGENPLAGTHANLWTQVSQAMKAFYEATVQLGVASQVVTFTLSDFGRTFKPNGGLGTDHGWGSHAFVMGGSVLGGNFYGVPGPNGTVFPTLVPNGPYDADDGTGARGRWIPTTATDQYAASLATWFGVADVDLPAVFPNLVRFTTPNLGYLAAA